MVRRPVSRDNDAMSGLLGRLKGQVEAVASRVSYPVGKLWRVEESADTGDLVATLPGQDTKVVLASPAGQCGTVLDCVGAATGDTLEWSADDRELRVRLSADAGNVLTAGSDRGLYAGRPAGSAGTSERWAFTGAGAPLGTSMLDVYRDTYGEFSGAFSYPGGRYGYAFSPHNLRPGDPDPGWYGPWYVDMAGAAVSNAHADPRVELSVSMPQLVYSTQGGGRSIMAMHLAPYSEYDRAWQTPLWSGNWLRLECTYWFTGYPTGNHEGTYGKPGAAIMSFYPVGDLMLDGDGRLYAANKWFRSRDESPGSSDRPLPLNRLVTLRWWLARDGSTDVCFIYYDDPSKTDHDDWVPFHSDNDNNRPLRWTDQYGDPPFFQFGCAPRVQWYPALPPYPNTPPTTVTVPPMWLSYPQVEFQTPDPVWLPPEPQNVTGPGSVTGVITGGTNAALPDATVTLARYSAGVETFVAAASSGPDGRYSFTGLPLLTYLVRARQEPSGPAAAPKSVTLSGGTPARVADLKVSAPPK